MNSYLVLIGLVFSSAVSHALDTQALVCNNIKVMGEVQEVLNPVTIVISGAPGQRPMRATVDNLPEGSGLRMNYQDIFGLGHEPDGNVIFAPKGEGDGTIQDVCGDENYSALIEVKKSGVLYCGKCQSL